MSDAMNAREVVARAISRTWPQGDINNSTDAALAALRAHLAQVVPEYSPPSSLVAWSPDWNMCRAAMLKALGDE